MTRSLFPPRRYLAAIAMVYGSVAGLVVVAGVFLTFGWVHPLLTLGFLCGVATGIVSGMFGPRIVPLIGEILNSINRTAHRSA